MKDNTIIFLTFKPVNKSSTNSWEKGLIKDDTTVQGRFYDLKWI